MDLQTCVMFVFVILHVPLITAGYQVEADTNKNGSYENILAYIFEDYNNQVSPNSNYETTTEVDVSISVQTVHSISEANMDYQMLVYIRQSWVDRRLRFNHIPEFSKTAKLTLNPNKKGSLWVPDLFITNEKESKLHKVTVPNELISIASDGTVFSSTRVSVKASCMMDLVNFPHDIQECMLEFESFGYTTADLVFHWSDDPVTDLDQVVLPSFTILGYRLENGTEYHPAGNFTYISVFFSFEREINYYLTHVFVPSILIVILAYVNFWVDVAAVPARVSIALITVLTLTTQSAAITGYMPKVSYVKAMDIWMFFCLIFVVIGLLEYAWANVLARREKKYKERAMSSHEALDDIKFPGLTAQRVDRVMRILFPVAFILFNVFYWFVFEFSETPGSFEFSSIF